jgi:hypothetical protein
MARTSLLKLLALSGFVFLLIELYLYARLVRVLKEEQLLETIR